MAPSDAILLVEDTPSDAVLTTGALRAHGIRNEIVVARDGIAAFEYLYGPSVPVLPLLMLLDVHLPGIDGLDVLRRVRADLRTKTLPVFVLTGSEDERDVMKTYANHATVFLRKPLDLAGFQAAMERHGLWSSLRFDG